jgi:hypothetical protein
MNTTAPFPLNFKSLPENIFATFYAELSLQQFFAAISDPERTGPSICPATVPMKI